MAQLICRMYRNIDQASAAAAQLIEEGHQHVYKFAHADGSSATDGLVAEMEKAFIPSYHAQIYARQIAGGTALVAAHAHFGRGVAVTQTLDEHQPIPTAVVGPPERSIAWDERTPISSALQLPLLAKHKLPFEAVWNVHSLTRRPTLVTACLGMPMTSRSATPLSTAMGVATLSKARRFLYLPG